MDIIHCKCFDVHIESDINTLKQTYNKVALALSISLYLIEKYQFKLYFYVTIPYITRNRDLCYTMQRRNKLIRK